MLQNINQAAILVAAAAKEAGQTMAELRANVAWADSLIPALGQREQEMADGVHKVMSTVIEDITEFRRRAQAMLDKLSGDGKPEEKPGEAEVKPPDPLALPAALDRRNTEEANGE